MAKFPMLKRPSAVAAMLAFAACGGATEIMSPPATPQDRLRIIAASNYGGSCARAGDIVPGPTVLVQDAAGRAQANIAVTFTVSSGGKIARSSDLSDSYGEASSGDWTLATAAGANVIVARLPDGTAVAFDLLSRTAPLGTVIARLDLVAVNGRALPVKDSDGDAITGGRLYLADDGTYSLGYAIDGLDPGETIALGSSLCSHAVYGVSSSYMEFYGDDSRHLAAATIHGDSLVIMYDNSNTETYRLSAGSVPAVR